MIDRFEARLTNLIADRLAGTTEIVSVARMRDGLPRPTATGPRAAVAVLSANPDEELGDDKPEVFGGPGERALRPVLRLAGEALVRLEVAEASSPNQRLALVRALDRLLLTLHDEPVRSGKAFDTGADQGFALDGGFRLARVAAVPTGAPPAEHRRFDVIYEFAGRFWPARAPLAGPQIARIPTRLVVLPMRLPAGLSTQAGASALQIEVPIDLRATGGATPALAARLQGATPPGALQGDPAGLPPGFVAVPVAGGAARISYLPPATLEEPEEAVIEIRYAADGGAFPVLETLLVAVEP